MNIGQLVRFRVPVNCKMSLLALTNSKCMKESFPRCYSVEAAIEDKKASNNADSTNALVDYVNPLRKPDFFEVGKLFTVKDLFDARVHFGHRENTLNDNMRQYLFGSRLGHLIFDLPVTAEHLRRALNFAAHVAYRGGIILFVCQYHQHCALIEQTAIDCKEFAHTRQTRDGLFCNSEAVFKTTIRLPDLLIFLNTLNTILDSHALVSESSKMNIPSIGIVDTNSDPTIISYPIPGNDDSPSAIELYCKLFKTAILKGKEVRQKELNSEVMN